MLCVHVQTVLLAFLIFYIFQSDASKEKHRLQYMFTALTKADSFPLFNAVAESDDLQIAHYSNEKQLWVRENQADVWKDAPPPPAENKNWYMDLLYRRAKCKKSGCSELHVLQRMIGCEVERYHNGSVSVTDFDELAFDGGNMVLQCTDESPFAHQTKMKRELQTGCYRLLKDFLIDCVAWITTFNNTKKSSPDVRVFAKKAPDDDSKLNLTCHVSGFYPRDIKVNIRLNKSIVNDQICSGIRPNADGFFQMRISVRIDRNPEGSYDCLVTHSSLGKPLSVKWDGTCLNCETPFGLIVLAVLAAVGIVFVLAIGYWVYRKNSPNGLMTSYRLYGGVNAVVQITDPRSANVSDEELIAGESADQ